MSARAAKHSFEMSVILVQFRCSTFFCRQKLSSAEISLFRVMVVVSSAAIAVALCVRNSPSGVMRSAQEQVIFLRRNVESLQQLPTVQQRLQDTES